MKKINAMALAVTFAATVVHAQVYSANIVGYNKAVSSAGLQIKSIAFNQDGSTPTSVYGSTLPGGSKIYAYTPGAGYNIAEYIDFGGGSGVWSQDFDLSGASSHWVEIPAGGGSITNVIAGEVELADSVTNSIVSGLQMLSYPYPVELQVQALELSPAGGDKVYIYTPSSGYNIVEWIDFGGGAGVWSDPSAVIPLGGGFWYESASSYDWIVNRPF